MYLRINLGKLISCLSPQKYLLHKFEGNKYCGIRINRLNPNTRMLLHAHAHTLSSLSAKERITSIHEEEDHTETLIATANILYIWVAYYSLLIKYINITFKKECFSISDISRSSRKEECANRLCSMKSITWENPQNKCSVSGVTCLKLRLLFYQM